MNKHQKSKGRGLRSFLSLLLVVLMMVSTLSDLGIAFAETGDAGEEIVSESPGGNEVEETVADGENTGEEGLEGPFALLDAPSANENLSITVTPIDAVDAGGVIERPSGLANKITVGFLLQAREVQGVIVAIPVPAAGTGNKHVLRNNMSISGASYAAVDNPAGLAPGRYWMLTVPIDDPAVSTIGYFTMDYYFDGGTTPNGDALPVTAFIMEAEPNGAGGWQIKAGGASASSEEDYIFRASADEIWEITKSVDKTDTPALVERDYIDVPESANDSYAVTYTIHLNTSGNGKDQGRVNQSAIHIKDVLSGYLAAGQPAIGVFETTILPAVELTASANITPSGAGATTIEFDVPNVDPAVPMENRTFTVVATYNKDDYTEAWNAAAPSGLPKATQNTAQATNVPIAGTGGTVTTDAPVVLHIGYKQKAPELPSLAVKKHINTATGVESLYTGTVAAIYNPAPNPPTAFKLERVSATGGATSTVEVDAAGIAAFAHVAPGTYKLTESTGIPYFYGMATAKRVVVSEPNADGYSTLTIGDWADGADALGEFDGPTTMNPAEVKVVNQEQTLGSIKLYVGKQRQNLVGSPVFGAYTGAGEPVLKDSATGTAPTGVTFTNNGGGWYTFHNVDTTKTYTVDLDGISATLADYTPGEVFVQPGVAGNQATVDGGTITASDAGPSVYSIQYASNTGSFVLGKVFLSPSGLPVNVGNFSAAFNVYAAGDTGFTTPLNPAPITVNQSTNVALDTAVVQLALTPGTYVIKEVGLTGLAAANDYNLQYGVSSSTASVTITAGRYDTRPTGGSINAEGLFINNSSYGELALYNYGYTGTPAGAEFIVSGTTAAGDAFSKNYTVPAAGSGRWYLPAGTYTVAPAAASNAVLSSVGTPVTIVAGAPSIGAPTVVGNDPASLSLDPSARQVAGFVQATMPHLRWTKENGDTGAKLSGGSFVLYKKNGANWDLVTNAAGTAPLTQTAAAATGAITFNNLPAGEYALVEFAVPASTGLPYALPGYAADFHTGTGVALADFAASVSTTPAGLPTYTITTAQYGVTAQTVPVNADETKLVNIRPVKLAIRTAQADSRAVFPAGAEYELRDAGGTVIGIAKPMGAGYIAFYDPIDTAQEITLAPGGSYSITQSAAHADYVKRTEAPIVAISVNAKGVAAITNSFGGPIGNGAPTDFEWDTPIAANNAHQLTITNIIKPDVTFVKYGETNTYNIDGSRYLEPLPGAVFQLTYEKSGVTYYAQFDAATGNMTGSMAEGAYNAAGGASLQFTPAGEPAPGTDAAVTATLLTASEAPQAGLIRLNKVDPTVDKYDLNELWAPDIIDMPGEQYAFAKKHTLEFVRSDDGMSYEARVKLGSYTLTDPEPYSLINTVDPYYVNLKKWLIHAKGGNGSLILSGFNSDSQKYDRPANPYKPSASVDDAEELTKIGDAEPAPDLEFEIWKLAPGLTRDDIPLSLREPHLTPASPYGYGSPTDAGPLHQDAYNAYDAWLANLHAWFNTPSGQVDSNGNPIPNGIKKDEMTTGTGGNDGEGGGSLRSAYSTQLSAGSYVLVESKLWSLADPSAGLAIHSGTSHPQTAANMNQGWANASQAMFYYFELNEDPNNPDRLANRFSQRDPVTGIVYLNLNLGNYDNAEPGVPLLNRSTIQVAKKGYNMRADGTATLLGPLMNVNFDIYYAYVGADGKYHKLGSVLDTISTRIVQEGETMRFGEFISPFYSFPQVPYMLEIPGVTDLEVDDGTGTLRPMSNGEKWAAYMALTPDQIAAQAEPGALTLYLQAIADAYPAEMSGRSTLDKIEAARSFCLLLEEKGPLPTSYVATNAEIAAGRYPAYGVNLLPDFHFGTAQETYWARNTTYVTIDPSELVHGEDVKAIRNYNGEGRINVEKFADITGITQLTGAQFKLYRAPTDAALEADPTARAAQMATWVEVATITAGDNDASPATNGTPVPANYAANTTSKLLPGYYFLVEETAPAGYNKFGQQSISTQAGGVKTAWTKAKDGIIGPITLGSGPATVDSSNAESRKAVVEVEVYDKPLAKLSTRNWWNGAASADNNLTATYRLQGAGTAAAYDASITVVSGTVAAGNNNTANTTANTFINLVDGAYTLTETAISGPDTDTTAAAYKYVHNAVVVTFTVEGGVISDIKSKTGVNTPAAIPPATLGADNVLSNKVADVEVITVNHPYRGALLIKKGYTDYLGIKHAVTAADPAGSMASATFDIKKDDGTGNYAAYRSVTWTQASDTPEGLRVNLPAGSYSIEETDVKGSDGQSSTVYGIDAAPVYFTIGETGIVYLQNADAAAHVGDTENAPIAAADTGNSGRVFYNPDQCGVLEVYKIPAGKDYTVVADRLTGVKFEVYSDAACQNLAATLDYEAAAPTPTNWNAAGHYYSVPLPQGEYWIKETKAPDDYAALAAPVKVEVARNATLKKAIENAPLTGLNVLATVNYDSIGGVVPAEKGRVANLPISLYKLRAGGSAAVAADWVFIKTVNTNSVSGIAAFSGLDVGTYRVVEENLTAHGWLKPNEWFDPIYNDSRLPAIFTVSYAADALQIACAPASPGDQVGGGSADRWQYKPVEGSDARLSGWQLDHAADLGIADTTHTLTIDHAFAGMRFAAQKVDYDTGAPLSGATFNLYDADMTLVDTKVSNAYGFAVFDPIAIPSASRTAAGYTYYIQEAAAPSGYILSAYFDSDYTLTKAVVGGKTPGPDTLIQIFKDKKHEGQPDPSVTKTVDAAAAALPLRESGFDAVFTIAVPNLNNTIPLDAYKVTDAGLRFYGKDANDATVEAVEDATATPAAPAPGYAITEVRVYPSLAKPSSTASLAPVYARVNGGAWQELSEPYKAWTPTAPAVWSGVEVEYATRIMRAPGDYTYEPWIGNDFRPGNIELRVAFDAFQPTKLQPEVDTIKNNATLHVTRQTAIGTIQTLQLPAQAVIAVPVPARPIIKLTKALKPGEDGRDGKAPPAGQPLILGSLVEYELTLTNCAESQADLEAPRIVDFMQPELLTLEYGDDGKPLYTLSAAPGVIHEEDTVNPFRQVDAAGSIVMWSFPRTTLHPGDSITILLLGRLAVMSDSATVDNEAFATSDAPLSPSLKYPTGASFAGLEPFTGARNTIFENAPNGLAASDYAKLIAADSLLGNKGLFVRAAEEGLLVVPSAMAHAQKSIRVTGVNADSTPYDSGWVSSKAPVDVHPGDTIHYRLQVDNGIDLPYAQVPVVTQFADQLPIIGDGRASMWTKELIEATTVNMGSVSAIARAGGGSATAQTIAPNVIENPTTKAKTLTVDIAGGYRLEQGNLLTVTYDWELPAANDPAWDTGLLANNALQVGVNNFTAYMSTFTQIKSNSVAAKLVAPPVTIAGYVWEDTNIDGEWSAAEPQFGDSARPLPAATVTLYEGVEEVVLGTPTITGAQAVGTTTTDAYGHYEFTNLPSSYGSGLTYQVVFTNPDKDAYNFTPAKASGVGEAVNSDAEAIDADYGAGTTAWFRAETSQTGVNAGLYRFSTLTGWAWLEAADSDNGTKDAGETTLVPGVTVTLKKGGVNYTTGANGGAYANAVVSADGTYSFSRLPAAGDYTVVFDKGTVAASLVETYLWARVNNPGYPTLSDTDSDADYVEGTGTRTQATAATAAIAVPYGGNAKADAGIYPLGNSIGDYVWLDANRDGIQDANETGINAVTVRLYSTKDLRTGPTYGEVDAANGFLLATAVTENHPTSGLPGYFQFATCAAYQLDSGADVRYWLVFENPDGENYGYTLYHSGAAAADSDVGPIPANLVEDPAHPGDNWFSEGSTQRFTLTGGYTEDMDCGLYEIPQYKAIFDPRNDGKAWNVTGPGTGWALNGGKWEITVREGRRVPMPNPSPKRDGYTFNGGWFLLDDNHSWSFTAERMPGRDIELYAKWQRKRDDTDDPTPVIPIPGLPPKTGDAAAAPWAVLILAIAIMGWMDVRRRKKNRA
ncbi:MAG: InlB B-repeat-containing protein [Christensenellaceae bacterium]|nr:InlB B-repeat-containing protein [Christensenellaceae bacterium]